MTIRLVTTALAAFAFSTASFALPAQAGGQFSVSFAPTDAKQQQALGLGLSVFSIVKGMSGKGAIVSQNGTGNAAGINQGGWGNNGVILQEGNNHAGTINQSGNGNSCALFQFGQGTDAQCNQSGNGQSGITTVFGF